MSDDEVQLVSNRSCDGCTLCCKLLSITALGKARQKWCEHCDIGTGCRVYSDRPRECKAFYCGYLLNQEIGEHWKPSKSRMVLDYEADANRIVVHVDKDRSDSWRREPYVSEIKRWAIASAQHAGQVVVWQGLDAVVVLPDGEKNIGRVKDDQIIIIAEKMGLAGPVYDVIVMEKDDPRLQQLKNQAQNVTDNTGGQT